MSQRQSFAKSAIGFVMKRKRSLGGKGGKVSHAQIRHDCLDLALYELWLDADEVPYPKSHLKVYENKCEEFEQTNDFKQALIMTIRIIAENNRESREFEIEKVIGKSLARLEVMTKNIRKK